MMSKKSGKWKKDKKYGTKREEITTSTEHFGLIVQNGRGICSLFIF